MPKVSVCIPAYNQIKFLKKTIDSVLSQTYTDYEIIITDDSKTDIVRDFVSSYNLPEKIKYYKNSKSLGSPSNWNEAMMHANGEYLKIVHHDDWFNYDYSLAHYVRLLDENPDVEFAFSASQVIFDQGEEWIHSITNQQMLTIMENPLILLTANYIGAPSAVIFRNNKKLSFDPNLKWLVDVEYYLRTLDSNRKIAYDPEPLIVTFGSEGRVTDDCKNNKEVEVFEFFYVLNSIKEHFNKYSLKQKKVGINQAIYVCNSYDIKGTLGVKECGYGGPVDGIIKIYFFVNTISQRLGNLFLKIWQKAF